ncbi:MAG: PD40 domain-containing protein [Deltaproteobacteria bacterium]|nr:PD40 domain-containing protein [Deltaproteobacteria bacterium]
MSRVLVLLALGVLTCTSAPSRMLSTEDSGGLPEVAVQDTSPAVDTAVPIDRAPVRTVREIFVGGAPMESPMRFGGREEASRAPALVYPEDGTIVPPNLPSFEVHFTPGTGNDLFEVTFAGEVTVLRVYTPCNAVGGGCVLTLDTAQFGQVADASRAGGRVRLAVRGTTRAPGGAVGSSMERSLGVTQQDLRGGVYWWSSVGNILRYDFGREGARPEVFLSGNLFACVGCHVLSRDGRRVSVGRGIPGPAAARYVDTASRMETGAPYGGNFGTYSPDLRRYLNSDGARLTLLDGETAMPVPGLSGEVPGSMPDWSPNNNGVVFSRARTPPPPLFGQPGHNAPADLMFMEWRGSTFVPPTVLLMSSGENNYYPSFSPDGQWVVFNRSAMTSYDAPDAHLWMVRGNGMGGPVNLARANSAMDGNSWPKWAPFREVYAGELTEALMWITFSSRRPYGLRTAGERTAQLWMAAVRPDRIGPTSPDPSAPAFWLPFQDLRQGNHIAQWTEEVRRMGCMMDRNCPSGELCQAGRCVGAPP